MRLPKHFSSFFRCIWLLALVPSLALLAETSPAAAPAPIPPLAPAEPISIPRDPSLPTLFIAGDSTAAEGPITATGWGVPFASYLDLKKINFVNGARGGRSSRTFITEGLWDQLVANLKAGDTVLIQFGHNDAGAINDTSRARGRLRTLGEETEQIDNLVTKRSETVHSFGWYLRKMIADVRAKGATPIVFSLTVRNEWKAGKVERANGPWSALSAEVAKNAHVAFIDLTTLIADEYERRGAEAVNEFFPKDHTHTNPAGADLNASLVIAALKNLTGNSFGPFFSAKGQAVAAAPASATINPGPRRAAATPADPKLPTLFLIGDSTVHNGAGDGAGGQWGWGEPIAAYFDPKKINVVNRAVGGLSSRTYLTLGSWERVLPLMKPGDFVIMQFGHNDDWALNDEIPNQPLRARGTIKGVSDESVEIDNVMTKKHEVVHTYGWYLRRFIADARERGVTPIVASLVPRQQWDHGRVLRSPYVGWAAEVAKMTNVPFIPLNEIIAVRYEALGEAAVEPLFADKDTHQTRDGAELNAASVVAGLKGLPNHPLNAYLSAKGDAVAPK